LCPSHGEARHAAAVFDPQNHDAVAPNGNNGCGDARSARWLGQLRRAGLLI
jgi:hypothetical protein